MNWFYWGHLFLSILTNLIFDFIVNFNVMFFNYMFPGMIILVQLIAYYQRESEEVPIAVLPELGVFKK